MRILGICHDVIICSAALIEDGRVVAAVASRRLARSSSSRRQWNHPRTRTRATRRRQTACWSSSRRSRISLACCRQYGHPIRRTANTRHGPVAQSCDADTIFASGHVLSATRPSAAWSIESAAAVAIVVVARAEVKILCIPTFDEV